MNLDGPLDPPDPTPVGFCAICDEPVYVWETAEDGWGNLVHDDCKPQELPDD